MEVSITPSLQLYIKFKTVYKFRLQMSSCMGFVGTLALGTTGLDLQIKEKFDTRCGRVS